MLLLKINVSTIISMRSRRELSIDMFIHRSTLKNNRMALLSCFTFMPGTRVRFCCTVSTGSTSCNHMLG